MEYKIDCRITKTEISLAKHNVYIDIKRQLACKIIQDMKMDHLEKLFRFRIINPDDYIPVTNHDAELLRQLKEIDCMLFQAKINVI